MMHRRFWPVVGWPVPPDSGSYPVMPMEGFRTELRSLGEAYDCQTFRFVVDEVIAEGDRVVLTVHNEGQYPDGEPYEMGYCFIFTICDGKIVHVIEYADTHYGFAKPRGWHLEHGDDGRAPSLPTSRANVAGGGQT
jgi:hypothetical protein